MQSWIVAGEQPSSRKNSAKRRVEYSDQKFQADLQIMQIFSKYDTNGSKKLEPEQLRNLLRDLSVTESDDPGLEPTDDEVRFVLTVADKRNNESIDQDEVLYAVRIWKNYMQDKPLIDAKMAKYDTDRTGKLNRQQLTNFLVDLNDGKQVTEEEVDWVFRKADVLGDGAIGGIELKCVIAAWNSHVEDRKNNCNCTIL